MEAFEDVFEHHIKYKVIRCRQCQYAVVPSQVRTHLAKFHLRLSKSDRRSIVLAVESLAELAQVPADVIYPHPDDMRVDGFPVWHNGLRCSWKDENGAQCRSIYRTVFRMQQHCKNQHDWVNAQHRGGDMRAQRKHTPNALWEEHRAYQQFFRVPQWKRLFEVEARHHISDEPSHDPGTRDRDETYHFFRRQEEDLKQSHQDAAEQANRVDGFEQHRSTVVPWLRETGIVDHVRGLKKDEIRAAITLPAGDEEAILQTIGKATGELLRDAHRYCFDGPDCMLTWPCRVVLGRFQSLQVEAIGRTRPFDPYKEPSTLKKYFSLVKQFLAYFSRVAIGPGYHFNVVSDEVQRPEDVIELTEEQHTQWNAAYKVAGQIEVNCDFSKCEEVHVKLKDLLLELLMLLICHHTGARRYRSPLLSFCAMLSIKPSTLSWMEPGNFNSHLSGIIWVAQLLIFYDSARKELHDQGETLGLVKHCCERFLQQTVESPMGEILRWRLLLFHISKESVSGRQAEWDEAEQILTYQGTELHMDQIPTLLESEYRESRRLLYDDLMFGLTDLRRVHAWALSDNVNVDTVDWNFIHHRDNTHLLHGSEQALLSAIEQTPRLSDLLLARDRQSPNGFVWRENAMASYEMTVQAYLRRLCSLVHITGGQPIRESEFFSMTHRNTQRLRSLTIRHRRLMIHVQYHKGQQQTGKYKDNIRFLAHPISDLLLDYIVYVLPLRQIFLRQSSPKALISPFLWETNGKVWPESQLTRCLQDASTRAGIPRLHISNWRQMTVAIVKTKFVNDIGSFEVDEEDEDAEEMDLDVRAMTKQRNHKTQTVNRAYANQTGPTFGNVWDGLVRMDLRASTLWQDFWGVETILKPLKRPREDGNVGGLTKRVARGIYKPRKPWSSESLLGALQKMTGDSSSTWKSQEQEQALSLIMSWTDQVVAILPTGAGKSLLFMLPCTLTEAEVTVVVVPLVSLRTDLLRRIKDLGIEHLEWLPGERREASLVLVSVEAASTKEFLGYAQSLVYRQRLDRIVIDECHLTVTAVDYRPSIIELMMLRSLNTQFVYLTATLPPSMLREFQERNYLRCPKIVRKCSNRPNIFYMVRRVRPGGEGLLEQTAEEARDVWERSNLCDHARDKIILYTQTRLEAERLSEILACDCYHSESGTAEEKKLKLEKWTRCPQTPYIVATTALAEGFDYPCVRLVINVNEPDSLILFSQQSGRAGRDGQKAYSMVLLPATWEPQHRESPDQQCTADLRYDHSLRKLRDKQAVHRYLRGDQCFRTSLTEALDDEKDRRWCMSDDVACDVCKEGHQSPVESRTSIRQDIAPRSGLSLIQQERLNNHLELSQYQEHLAAVRGTCVLCRVLGKHWDHEFPMCTRRHDVFHERARAKTRHQVRGKPWLKPFTACYWCLNPQSVCQRAEKGAERMGGLCTDRDIVLPICLGVFWSARGPQWVQEEFSRDFALLDEYIDWIGEVTQFGGEAAIQGVRVAARILEVFFQARPMAI